jgi:CheY-like chemotaxis protein
VDSYEVVCPTCGNTFDAMESAWCSCLAASRTLVCPHCLKCFCKASRAFKQKFWASAPDSLWKRRAGTPGEAWSPAKKEAPGVDLHPLVLVVEDDSDVRQMVTSAVEKLGYNVIVARNGLEGLEMARAYRPDLVITDALMPKLDGREMARRLKEDPETREIKVAVMTSVYTATKYRVEAMKVFKVDDYLQKPLELAELHALLLRHVG